MTVSSYQDRRCHITRTASKLIFWTSVIVIVGVWPLDNFVGHTHWQYIKWVPTAEDLRSPKYLLDIFTDIIGNTLLFLPFGYGVSRLLNNRTLGCQLIVAAALGGALSLGIEYYQVYCHNRFPSILDVVTNVSGSLIGARFARARNTRLTLTGLTRPKPSTSSL